MMKNQPQRHPDTKIVVLGNASVGKSALVVRFLTKRFIWEYDPTLECTYTHRTYIDDELASIEILDTAGKHSLSDLEGPFKWGEAFIIVYSIIDRRSFEDVTEIKKYLNEVVKPKLVPCLLIGNKCDLEHARTVTYKEGEHLAAELDCAFFETSASDGSTNIDEVFYEAHREVKRRKLIEGKPRRRSSAHQVMDAINKIFKIQT